MTVRSSDHINLPVDHLRDGASDGLWHVGERLGRVGSTVDERDARRDAPIVKPAHHEDVGTDGDVASLERHRRERGDMHQSMVMITRAVSVRFDAESEPVDVGGLVLGDGDVDALLCATQEGSSRVELRGSDEGSETPGDLGEGRVVGSGDARYDVDEDFFGEG